MRFQGSSVRRVRKRMAEARDRIGATSSRLGSAPGRNADAARAIIVNGATAGSDWSGPVTAHGYLRNRPPRKPPFFFSCSAASISGGGAP